MKKQPTDKLGKEKIVSYAEHHDMEVIGSYAIRLVAKGRNDGRYCETLMVRKKSKEEGYLIVSKNKIVYKPKGLYLVKD
jgi:hypothetical protein